MGGEILKTLQSGALYFLVPKRNGKQVDCYEENAKIKKCPSLDLCWRSYSHAKQPFKPN